MATLRDYLTCEYRVKMPDKPAKQFNKLNMPGHCVKVPQQNNYTDCGLYLLQYVEHFFLVSFDPPVFTLSSDDEETSTSERSKTLYKTAVNSSSKVRVRYNRGCGV